MISYNGRCNRLRTHDNPATDCTRQCVDEKHQEDDQNKQNEPNDDILLVVSPDEMIQALERIYKPGEGCVRSAEGKEKKNKPLVRTDPTVSKYCYVMKLRPCKKYPFPKQDRLTPGNILIRGGQLVAYMPEVPRAACMCSMQQIGEGT